MMTDSGVIIVEFTYSVRRRNGQRTKRNDH